jgi:glucan-binding YG repeat protein
MSIPAFAQGWALNGNTWYYTDKNGSNVSESWQMSGDNWFYLGSTGAMEKDSVVEYKDHVYYVNEDGAMVTNCWRRLEYDGEECWMYFGPDGRAMEKGWKTIDEKKYHFTDFRMDYGWFENESNGARYYLGTENEGWIQQGWAFLGDDDDADKEEGWYYIKATGKYVTDKEEKIDGAYYAFNEEGKMLTNWVLDSDADSKYKYYDGENGCRADGWRYLEDIEAGEDSAIGSEEGWYYFKNGVPYSTTYKTKAITDGYGIAKINGSYFCFDANGKMVTGTVNADDGSWYYFNEAEGSDMGKMRTGTGKVGDAEDLDEEETYYFITSGANRGQAFTGIYKNALYDNGVLQKAEDAKYEVKTVEIDGESREFLVNKSGKVQTGSASGKKYTDSSEDIVWTVVKESDGTYTITSEYKD